MSKKNYQGIAIQEFKEGEGLFIRTFFTDNDFNLNGWGVTQKSIERDLSTGLDKSYFGRTAPIILTEDHAHPPDDVADMVAAQEPSRVGDFLRTGIDPDSGRGYVDAIITDPIAIELIQNGVINFVSPSIKAISEIRLDDGRVIVPRFKVNHLALVDNPAYGTMKAQIKGRCTGSKDECLKQLLTVQASTKNYNGNCVGKFSCGTMVLQADFESLPRPIQEIIENGDMLNKDHLIEVLGEEVTQDLQSTGEMKLEEPKQIPPGTFDADYATTHRGEQHFPIGSPQDKYLHTNHLPHSHVHINSKGEKEITRYDASTDIPEELHEMPYGDFSADSCTSKWIPELKSAHPEWSQDQVIAVAYSKCGESKKGSVSENEFWNKHFGKTLSADLKYVPERGFMSGKKFMDVYASVKDVKIAWGSKDHHMLHAMNLPHTHCASVKENDKLIAKARFNSNYRPQLSSYSKQAEGKLSNGIPDSKFDPEQLKKGIQVELKEHTNDPEIAKKIAKDHLVENSKYYDYLEKMEKSFKATEDDTFNYVKHNLSIFHAFAESLKPIQSKSTNMGEPEDDKDKDMEELKNANKALEAKVADVEKKNEDEKKKREELEASLQAMVKTPIIDKILQARKTLGMKEGDLSAARTSLEKFDVPTLQSMQAEFVGLATAKESMSADQSVRFPYQATEGSNLNASVEDKAKRLNSAILERCHNN